MTSVIVENVLLFAF